MGSHQAKANINSIDLGQEMRNGRQRAEARDALNKQLMALECVRHLCAAVADYHGALNAVSGDHMAVLLDVLIDGFREAVSNV
jgi:hypothetical protein